MTYSDADLIQRLRVARTSLISIAAELKAYPASGPEGFQATHEGIVPAPFDAYDMTQSLLEVIEFGLTEVEDVNVSSEEFAQARPLLDLALSQLAASRDLLLGTVNARRLQRGLPGIEGFGIPDN